MARIKVVPAAFSPYGSGSRIAFSIVSSPKHERAMLRPFSNCRDFINDHIISDYKAPATNRPVDKGYLRLLISRSPSGELKEGDVRRRIYAAKRVINMYEELAGWKTRSKIARVTFGNSGDEKHSCVWLLTGPAEWMKSTHLVSMVTLIFRIVVECGGFSGLETLEQVEAHFKNLCENYVELFPSGPGEHWNSSNRADISGLLAHSWPKYRMLMEMYDDLFRKRDYSYWNPPSMAGNWHSYGGIKSLCTFNIGVSALNAEIKGAWELWCKKAKK